MNDFQKALQELRGPDAAFDLIERTASKVAGKDALWLIKNVTQGIAWEYMPVSCGRRKFYDMRRMFFYFLAKSKGYV